MYEKKVVRVKSENFDESGNVTICYLRISRCNSKDYESRIDALATRMNNEGEDNYLILGDINRQGKDPNKPALEEVCSFIKEGKVKTFVVREIARIGRKASETVSFVNDIVKSGIRFISIYDGIDSAKGLDMDKVIELAKFAEYCADTSSKRDSNAIHEKVCAGIPLYHGGPYGYIPDPKNKHKLLPDSEAAENVKYIFTKYCELKSTTAVAKIMSEKKVPNPSAYRRLKNDTLSETELTPTDYIWGPTSIYSILINVLYTGDTVCLAHSKHFEKKFIPDTHEAIIDKALFAEVREILKR